MVYKLMTRLRAGARRWLELAVVATTRDRRLLPVGANAPTAADARTSNHVHSDDHVQSVYELPDDDPWTRSVVRDYRAPRMSRSVAVDSSRW